MRISTWLSALFVALTTAAPVEHEDVLHPAVLDKLIDAHLAGNMTKRTQCDYCGWGRCLQPGHYCCVAGGTYQEPYISSCPIGMRCRFPGSVMEHNGGDLFVCCHDDRHQGQICPPNGPGAAQWERAEAQFKQFKLRAYDYAHRHKMQIKQQKWEDEIDDDLE